MRSALAVIHPACLYFYAWLLYLACCKLTPKVKTPPGQQPANLLYHQSPPVPGRATKVFQ